MWIAETDAKGVKVGGIDPTTKRVVFPVSRLVGVSVLLQGRNDKDKYFKIESISGGSVTLKRDHSRKTREEQRTDHG